MSGSELDSFDRRVLKSFAHEYDGDANNWDDAVENAADDVECSTEEIENVITTLQDGQWRQLHAFLETDCEHTGEFTLSSVENEVVETFTQSYSMWDDSEPPAEWISAETGLSKTHTTRILCRLYGELLTAIDETVVDELYACVPSKYMETGFNTDDTGVYATTNYESYIENTDEQENERERMVVISVTDEDVAPKDLTEKEVSDSEPEDIEEQDETPTEYIIVDEVPADSIQPYLW